jgi:membrane-associated phospholipid phosphatase
MISRIKQNRFRNRIFVFSVYLGIFFQHAAEASDEIEKSGDVLQVVIPVIAYGATLHLNDSEGQTQFYKSFFTSLLVTYGLKHLINKKRPNGSGQSFPSGHTSAAFQGASFIHKRYGLKYGIPAYIGACFVGYSRVESKNHYIEDVIAGAAVGVLSSFCFTKPYKGFIITPSVGDGAYSLRITKKW